MNGSVVPKSGSAYAKLLDEQFADLPHRKEQTQGSLLELLKIKTKQTFLSTGRYKALYQCEEWKTKFSPVTTQCHDLRSFENQNRQKKCPNNIMQNIN